MYYLKIPKIRIRIINSLLSKWKVRDDEHACVESLCTYWYLLYIICKYLSFRELFYFIIRSPWYHTRVIKYCYAQACIARWAYLYNIACTIALALAGHSRTHKWPPREANTHAGTSPNRARWVGILCIL